MAADKPRPPAAAGWLTAFAIGGRALALTAPVATAFVIVTALCAHVLEAEALRMLVGVAACLLLPLVLRHRIAHLVRARSHRKPPDAGSFVALTNCALALALAFGFADDVGRALRRHGDWFLGERNGAVARMARAAVGGLAAYLEKFDPPAELAPLVIPPDKAKIPFGPYLPGQEPPEAQPVTLVWYHPLAGPRRALPLSEDRRFGASRPPPRPPECELGHCGVDLGTTVGEPVFAAFDGVIEKIERDAERGGRAGRYVRIGHKSGMVVTRYIHLDTIRADLSEGDHVAGGQLIGRVGRSGIMLSGPHLHFALSVREGGPRGGERYLDPEPLLRGWQLPDAQAALRDLQASSAR
ncbi:MAG TPA: M23 family metallopeptidase [Polyangia bacterium]|nr:M23 family metallopeptidase [Polyangia bacterium]